MTIKLSELAHIKVVVHNAEEAYQILRNIFGAERLKEDFINSYIKVVYVGIGDFILQYIEPIAEEGPWYDHIQTKGPGVHSLAYYVENIKEILYNAGLRRFNSRASHQTERPDSVAGICNATCH